MGKQQNPNQKAQVGASLASGLSGIASSVLNAVSNRQAEKRQVARQQQEIARVQQREDTAISRATRDSLAQGIDPRVNGSPSPQAGASSVEPAPAIPTDFSNIASAGQAVGGQIMQRADLDQKQLQNEFDNSRYLLDDMYDQVNKDLELATTDLERYESIQKDYEKLLVREFEDYQGDKHEFGKNTRDITEHAVTNFLQNHTNFELGAKVGLSKGSVKETDQKTSTNGEGFVGSLIDKLSSIAKFGVGADLNGKVDWGKMTQNDIKDLTSTVSDDLYKHLTDKSKKFKGLDEDSKKRIADRLAENQVKLLRAMDWRYLVNQQKRSYNKSARELWRSFQKSRYRSSALEDIEVNTQDTDTTGFGTY